jgi:hypothetical protein
MSYNSVKNYQCLPGAMYPAELEWLKIAIENEKVDLLIECGRQDGASSRWYHENLIGLEVYSIDLDDRPDVLENSTKNLAGTNVKAVTGDVFVEVPLIVRRNPSRRIGIIEDAVKGWPGLALLLSCVFYENVVLIAQHNNHVGHKTRDFWLNLTKNKAFLESSDNYDISKSLEKWIGSLNDQEIKPNRETDHSSLAVMGLDTGRRALVIDKVLNSIDQFGLWNPIKLRAAHCDGMMELVKKHFKDERFKPWLKKKR